MDNASNLILYSPFSFYNSKWDNDNSIINRMKTLMEALNKEQVVKLLLQFNNNQVSGDFFEDGNINDFIEHMQTDEKTLNLIDIEQFENLAQEMRGINKFDDESKKVTNP